MLIKVARLLPHLIGSLAAPIISIRLSLVSGGSREKRLKSEEEKGKLITAGCVDETRHPAKA